MTIDTDQDVEQPKRRGGPIQFFREVRAEGRKVTWATRQEVTVSTIMVLMMCVAAGVFFFFVDSLLRFLIGLVLSIGT